MPGGTPYDTSSGRLLNRAHGANTRHEEIVREGTAKVREERKATARDRLTERIALAYVGRFGFNDVDTIAYGARTLAAQLQEANEGPDQ